MYECLAFACSGIMNGLDTEEWDPSRDPLLPPGARFAGFADSARGKSCAKHALQTRMGLWPDTTVRVALLWPACILRQLTCGLHMAEGWLELHWMWQPSRSKCCSLSP